MHRPINVSLDATLIAQVDTAAEARHTNRSQLIAEALAAYLAVPVPAADKPGPKRHALTRLEANILAILSKSAMPLPASGLAYGLGRPDSAIKPALASMTLAGILREVPVTESGMRRWTVA